MLTSIQLQNWRGHMNTTVPLAPFTVLVGSNAVGKTAVLEGVVRVGNFLASNTHPKMRSSSTVLRHGSNGGSIAATFRGNHPSAASFQFKTDGEFTGRCIGGFHNKTHGAVEFEAQALRGWIDHLASMQLACRPFVAVPSAKRIAAASKLSRTEPEGDGFGTSSALAALKINDDQGFSRIVDGVRRIVPQVVRLVLKPSMAEEILSTTPTSDGFVVEHRRVEGYSLWVKFTDGAVLPADAVSEGTLLAIATLTMIECHQATVLLIDDIDRALHMRAQSEFVTALRKLQEARPTLQIIATTHSPLIVQHFDDDEVVVMARHTDGRVAAKKLSQHPERKRYASLSAAELWVAEQEDWVLAP